MRSLSDVTLYEIMAQDLDVWVKRSNDYGFDLEIDDEEGCALVRAHAVHPFAAESFADFCRQYLACFDRANQ